MKKPRRRQRWQQSVRPQIEWLEDRLPPGDWRALPFDFISPPLDSTAGFPSFPKSNQDVIDSPSSGKGLYDFLAPPPSCRRAA